MITCPHCGLPNWKKIGQVLNDVRKFLIVNICECDHCKGKFYLLRTRTCTYIIKFDDVDPREIIELSTSGERRRYHGKKRKNKSSTSHDSYHGRHDGSSRENEKKS